MAKTDRWLLVPAAITLVLLAASWWQWRVRHEPAAVVLPQPEELPPVVIVAESDFETLELVEIELNRLARLGYRPMMGAGGIGGRWFVMERSER